MPIEVRIETRDAVILEDLYDIYGATCYRLAHRMVADESLACTIVRDVFVAVWSGECVFDPTRGSVESWLLRATHRRAVSVLRNSPARSNGVVDIGQLGSPPTLHTVLRYVLELAYFGGHTEAEIATLTGTTVSMVKTMTLEALRGMSARPPAPACS